MNQFDSNVDRAFKNMTCNFSVQSDPMDVHIWKNIFVRKTLE